MKGLPIAPGSEGVDTDARISRGQAKELRSAGKKFILRAIGHSQQFESQNLSLTELEDLLSEDLAVGIYSVRFLQRNKARDWSAATGREDAEELVRAARTIGAPGGKCVTLNLDFEGDNVPHDAALAYTRAGRDTLRESEYRAGGYFDQSWPLDSAEISALDFDDYWQAGGTPPPCDQGYSMLQRWPSGTCASTEVDFDFARADHRSRTMGLLCPDTWGGRDLAGREDSPKVANTIPQVARADLDSRQAIPGEDGRDPPPEDSPKDAETTQPVAPADLYSRQIIAGDGRDPLLAQDSPKVAEDLPLVGRADLDFRKVIPGESTLERVRRIAYYFATTASRPLLEPGVRDDPWTCLVTSRAIRYHVSLRPEHGWLPMTINGGQFGDDPSALTCLGFEMALMPFIGGSHEWFGGIGRPRSPPWPLEPLVQFYTEKHTGLILFVSELAPGIYECLTVEGGQEEKPILQGTASWVLNPDGTPTKITVDDGRKGNHCQALVRIIKCASDGTVDGYLGVARYRGQILSAETEYIGVS